MRGEQPDLFTAHRSGLFDLSGNVLQWLEDWYKSELQPTELKQKYPKLQQDGGGQEFKATRGAAWWVCDRDLIQCNALQRFKPGYRSDYIGFRVVLAVEAP